MTNQPRYEVSIEAPFLTWGKGTILIPAEDGEVYSKEHGYSPSYLKLYLKDMDKFPSVFRLLKWWDRVPVEELPKYVRWKSSDFDFYFRVKEWNLIQPNKRYLDGRLFIAEGVDVNGGVYTWFLGYKYEGEIHPATEEEYIAYQKTKAK